jgi:hypothetical protein
MHGGLPSWITVSEHTHDRLRGAVKVLKNSVNLADLSVKKEYLLYEHTCRRQCGAVKAVLRIWDVYPGS